MILPKFLVWLFAAARAWDIRSAPFHPRIHNFGNTGLGGCIHAFLAPAATRLIDQIAYDGENVRRNLAHRWARDYGEDAQVLEVGCGSGTTTRELANAGFSKLTAIDTSDEMIRSARRRTSSKVAFKVMNGVDWQESVDLCILTFVLHELPLNAQWSMLSALTQHAVEIVVVDIDPLYNPSTAMRSGEPFVDAYKQNANKFFRILAARKGFYLSRRSIMQGHVVEWRLRSKAATANLISAKGRS